MLVTERQILRDAIGIRRPENAGLAQRPAPLRTFADHQMAFARPAEQDFSGGTELEPLGY